MNIKHRSILFIIICGMLLTSCKDTTPDSPVTTAPATSASTLPDPQVYVTNVPPAGGTVRKFLDAWQADDYDTMYSLLSAESQQAITAEQFKAKFVSLAEETALREMRYELLTDEPIDSNNSRVNYRMTLASNIIGDLTRETGMNLKLEDGVWRIAFSDDLILPELAGGNMLRMDLSPPGRLPILDRLGRLLAGQSEATSIGVYPEFIDPENADGLFGLLSRASGLTSAEIRSRVENSAPGDYLPLGQVETQEAGGLLNSLASYGAVALTNYVSRYYPENGVAPHLVGYVRAIDPEELTELRRAGYRLDEKIGRKGIESWGEQILGGVRGGTLYQINPQGVPLAQLGSTASEAGETIYSTIDREFQLGVQEAMRGFRGAAVVLEKDTGRVLAMASSPGFDQNSFQVENYNWWATLPGVVNDPGLPEFNRATQGLYPLGSVFKIITAAAALESGLFTPEYTYNCQYFFEELEGLQLRDWTYTRFLEDGETQPSGQLTLPQGLIRSCNPFFWHLSRALFINGKPNAVSDMARAFGLGAETGIEVVDEEAGTIPDPQSDVDAVNLGIGQGNVQVTPLQVAAFSAALGNGGTLFRPQAIEKIVAEDGTVTFEFKPEKKSKLPLSPETLQVLQDAMVGVARSNQPRGTAYLIFNGFNTPVAVKTGSATGQNQDPHSWFAGYTMAGREDKPDIAIAVVTEDAGEGSEISAPIFRRIVELYFQGAPGRLYPWEAAIGVTKTPTPLFQETPTPEELITP